MLSSDDEEHQLLQAAFYGSLDLVKSLLNTDNINARDAIGRTPLALACWGGHYEVAEFLLAAGADISGQFRQVSALKHAEIVELLLRWGADVNEEYTDGQRPLHHACERGNIAVAEVLLKYRADMNAKDVFGKTPLHYACRRGNKMMTELLLKYGADVNATDANLRTPLHYSCLNNETFILRTLLEHRAVSSSFDNSGLTPLNLLQPPTPHDVSILLDYGCGAHVPCSRPKCMCSCSVLMCFYREVCGKGDALIDVVAAIEKHLIKADEARLVGAVNCLNDILLDSVDWNAQERKAFRTKCADELSRMKDEVVGDSSATYFSVLNQDLPNLRDQRILKLVPEECQRKFPIYGDMIYCSFLKMKRTLLLERSTAVFSLTNLPRLPPECAICVLRYLPIEDLQNIAELCDRRR